MEIEYSEGALEDLAKLPKKIADQVTKKVARLQHGFHGNIKRLQNTDIGYRLRSGNYRILFDVENDKIVIQKIGHRRDVYD